VIGGKKRPTLLFDGLHYKRNIFSINKKIYLKNLLPTQHLMADFFIPLIFRQLQEFDY
jgi:hypothetical protein